MDTLVWRRQVERNRVVSAVELPTYLFWFVIVNQINLWTTTIEFILDAGSTPAASTIKGENMSIFILDWFKKEYDLETEEVERTVFEKRHNLNYMNECIKNNTPDK